MSKKHKRQDPLSELATSRPFVDGYDSYADDYKRWKRMNIVKGLVGVYELSDEQFQKDTRDLLSEIGLQGYEQLLYASDVDNSGSTRDKDATGSGWTSAVRSPYGHVRPIIFIRERIDCDDKKGEYNEEFVGVTRLLVLMHELGHAKDVSLGVNFDHDALKLDIVAAEVYAHMFVFRHTARMGYRLALRAYIQGVEDHLKSSNDAARMAAEKVFTEVSIERLKESAKDRDDKELRHAFEVSGRMKEFKTWASS